MYDDIKLFVKHLNNLSDLFEPNVGLLQGEISSPILFSLFLNDIELFLQHNDNPGLTLDQLNMYILLYADDSVVLSELLRGYNNYYLVSNRGNYRLIQNKNESNDIQKGW